MVFKEAQRLLHGHLQHLVDVLALVAHIKGFAVVARTLAHVARHVDVRKEVHLDLEQTIAAAGFAAAALDVEAEAVFLVAAGLGVGRHGKDAAHQIEQTGVRGGVGARRAADGALIDGDDLVQLLYALHAVKLARTRLGTVEHLRQVLVDNLVDEAGLARPAYTCDAAEYAQGQLYVDVFQVVFLRAPHREPAGRLAPLFRHRNGQFAAEILAREGAGVGQNLVDGALCGDLAAVDACAGSHVHDVVSGVHGVLVMLHHDQRISQIAQALERSQELCVIALMQADGGLVQDVEHAHQAGADLRGQADALCFAAGEGGRRARQREVGQAHAVQKAQA